VRIVLDVPEETYRLIEERGARSGRAPEEEAAALLASSVWAEREADAAAEAEVGRLHAELDAIGAEIERLSIGEPSLVQILRQDRASRG
jgi:plasmid stability protein